MGVAISLFGTSFIWLQGHVETFASSAKFVVRGVPDLRHELLVELMRGVHFFPAVCQSVLEQPFVLAACIICLARNFPLLEDSHRLRQVFEKFSVPLL